MAQLEVKQSAMSWWELSPACLTGASAVNPGIHCMTLAKLADLGQIVEMRGGGVKICALVGSSPLMVSTLKFTVWLQQVTTAVKYH